MAFRTGRSIKALKQSKCVWWGREIVPQIQLTGPSFNNEVFRIVNG